MISTVGKTLALLTLVFLFVASIVVARTIETAQVGYSGVGMELVAREGALDAIEAANVVAPSIPRVSAEGPRAGESYQNVQVLGHLSVSEFTRLMVAMTQWVSPQQGCNYCHLSTNLASDDIYTKVVSRRMIQMTMHLNENWQSHVKQTGVACYTCHRGQPVPAEIWFEKPPHPKARAMVGNPGEQNIAAPSVGYTSLPSDPFTPFLAENHGIRVASTEALPGTNRSSIKQAEWTYGLMIHMTNSLGVNCTYCHNSRAWGEWSQSPPARTVAWHGIRMVRDLNQNYLVPLGPQYPANRLGPTGDAPKANCATCHYGAYKPLLGTSLLNDFPSLAKAVKYVPPPSAAETATVPAETEEAESSQEAAADGNEAPTP